MTKERNPKVTTLWEGVSQESDFRRLEEFDPLVVQEMVAEMKELLKSNSFIDAIIAFRKKYRYQLAVCKQVAELAGAKFK